jgi:low affinity Fe/Cu permease
MQELFRKFSTITSAAVGSPWAFMLAVGVILIWAVTGPLFHYSDTWQLFINTATTVTFLMVFLIQNTQNRDAIAVHLKLDELLRAVEGARTSFVDLEDLTHTQLARLQVQFARLHQQTEETLGAVQQEVHAHTEQSDAGEVPSSRERGRKQTK